MARKKEVGKIYKTTDGIFNGRKDIKKPRYVLVVAQRKDGALALVKLHGEGKNANSKVYIPGFVLESSKHKSLEKNSLVEMTVRLGPIIKVGHVKVYALFLGRDMEDMHDKVTRKEFAKIKKGVRGESKEQKTKHKKKMKGWHSLLKNKKSRVGG